MEGIGKNVIIKGKEWEGWVWSRIISRDCVRGD